jgi:hypothetical protein
VRTKPRLSAWDRILQLLDRIIAALRRFMGGAPDGAADEAPAPDHGDAPRPAEPPPDGGALPPQ